MRIEIEEVLDAARGQVRFRSGGESVVGCWAGPGEIPVGRELEAEVEVSEERIISVRPAFVVPQSSVAQGGGEVVVVGRAERIGDDGIIEFRVGQDLILLEPVGPLTNVVEGASLALRVPELRIYPRDL
ncbi:hypothetical protein [Actinoplanes missouriensis]|uniref:hypothetical protein n=1 Tax=Actinoplanes missouriensis TaxID=1866 RepID=UPI0012FBC0B7|nr:hypothetical protein [Actinoplanes missouriensis]